MKVLAFALLLALASTVSADSSMPPSEWANRQLPELITGSRSQGADGGAALPGLPGTIDRR